MDKFYRCRVRCERLLFEQLDFERGELRFEQIEFSGTEIDFGALGVSFGRVAFPRLVFEDVHFFRGRLRLELLTQRERMVWFRDCVLDSVAVTVEHFEDARPWVNLRNVELRGGSEFPARSVRA